MNFKTEAVKLLDDDHCVKYQVETECSRTSNGATRESSTSREVRPRDEDIGTTFVASDEEVFETKQVVLEGDKKKVTYTRKVSVHDKQKDAKHCHSNVPTAQKDKKARNKLIIASILGLVFMTVEIVGGILAGSLAIISDAAHLLTDFASFMISLVAIYLATRPATQRFNYGWHRAEILGAFASIILLWILTGVLAYEAVMRIVDDNYSIDSNIMLITAGIGVAFNLILGTTLHQHGHSHGGGGHGHSHGGSKGRSRSDGGRGHKDSKGEGLVRNGGMTYGSTAERERTRKDSERVGINANFDEAKVAGQGHGQGRGHKKEKNINVKAAFIHVIGDLLQSVGVLVAAFIIYYKPEWKIADPICTFFFSIIVVFTTINIMRDIVVVLMEGKPRSISFSEVRQALLNVEKVKDTHNLRMWSLTMDKVALSVHLVVEDECDAHEVLKSASKAIRSQFSIMDITIQVEEYVQDMDTCNECVGPC